MGIEDYIIDNLLKDLKRIENDLQNSTIYSSTIKTAKILAVNLEYYYEKAKESK